jgi:hypothetical protein
VRADALRMLGCVRTATVRQMAQAITAEDRDGRLYVRRAMKKLAELGLAETNDKAGRHPIWEGSGLILGARPGLIAKWGRFIN